MAIRNYPRWRRHLEFIRIENSAIRSAVPENLTLQPNMKWIGRLRYGHLNSFQDGGGRHLGFVRTGNSAVRSADPENPTLEQNTKDHPLQRYGHSRMLGAYGTPVLGEGEVVGGQRWHH